MESVLFSPSKSYSFLFFTEGKFTQHEINYFKGNGWELMSLGCCTIANSDLFPKISINLK